MKKPSIFLVSLIGLVFLSNAFAVNAKIGVIDFQQINTSPKAIKIQKNLQQQFAPKWSKINEKQKEISEMATKLKRDGTVMRNSDKQDLQNKITKTRKELASMMEDFKQKFAQAQQVMIQSFMADVKQEITKVAKKSQLDFVVPKDVMLYAQNQLDITDQVKKKLK